MRTREECDWAEAVEKIGGDFLLNVVAHELFMETMNQTFGFMKAMAKAGHMEFDEQSKTLTADEALLKKALILIMIEAQEDLDEQSYELVTYVVTATLESARQAMLWRDLSEQERAPLETAYMNYLRHNPEQLLSKGTCALPADDRNLPTMIRFLVWCTRSQGRLPSWYHSAENEIRKLAEQTKLVLEQDDCGSSDLAN